MLENENNEMLIGKKLGNNIKEIRKSMKYTQEKFAEELNITPQNLSSVERGISGISIDIAVNICKIGKCSANTLFKDIVKTIDISEKYQLLNNRDKSVINQMITYLLNTK